MTRWQLSTGVSLVTGLNLTSHDTSFRQPCSTCTGYTCWQSPVFRQDNPCMSSLGKVLSVSLIKPHPPPLVWAPVNSFEFQPCDHTPQAGHLTHLLRQKELSVFLPPSAHRLQRRLPGYLIPFAPYAFAPQRQYQTREPLSLSAFSQISSHSTATPGIPLSPSVL